MDANRRRLIKAVSTGLVSAFGAGVLGGFTAGIGERVLTTIYPPDKDIGDVQKETLSVLFGAAADIPSIFAGACNLQGAAFGIDRTSVYLRYSAAQFTSYFCKAFRSALNVVDTNAGDEFTYDYRRHSLFLGGPAANQITSRLLGYDFVPVYREGGLTKMPVPDRNHKRARWVLIYGETDYGTYGGKRLFARRYSSSTGAEVERPVFKLFDKKTNETYVPEIESRFLLGEWLTIVRLREAEVYKVIVGGMHGYSTEAFCRDIAGSLERLKSTVGDADQYQVVAPVRLQHWTSEVGRRYTMGEILWDRAMVEQIFE